jgi:hypothetical protein
MNKINYNILKRIKKESHETEHKAKISIYISCFFVFLFFGIFYYSIEKNKKTNFFRKVGLLKLSNCHTHPAILKI